MDNGVGRVMLGTEWHSEDDCVENGIVRVILGEEWHSEGDGWRMAQQG